MDNSIRVMRFYRALVVNVYIHILYITSCIHAAYTGQCILECMSPGHCKIQYLDIVCSIFDYPSCYLKPYSNIMLSTFRMLCIYIYVFLSFFLSFFTDFTACRCGLIKCSRRLLFLSLSFSLK